MKVNITKLIRPHLAGKVKTYDSIDPPERLAEQYGIPTDKIIKLNGNENPYGCSPKVIEEVAKAPLQFYPDPLQRKIRKALAKYTGLDSDHIVAGAGSDEIIEFIFQLFISPGDKIMDFDPTFGMYSFCARVAGADVRMVPRDESFEIDVEAAKNAIDSKTKVIFITTPNNPTGNLASHSQVKELLDTGRIVVVDEAYYEFCNETTANMILDHQNLVVLRTLSKWAGLAGLRIGYGLMSPTLIKRIIDIKSPYNVNVAAEAALLASLNDVPALLENVQLIVKERERLFYLLQEIPGVSPWPSYGNYILCQLPTGAAHDIYLGLAKRGIFVRFFNTNRLQDFFRTAVGTPEQTDALIIALKELVKYGDS